jgi:hypothetical protein
MLTDNNAMATIAVKDMAAARKFYEGTLHFKRSGGELEAIVRSLQDAGVRFEHLTCLVHAARATSISSAISGPRGSKTPMATFSDVNSG